MRWLNKITYETLNTESGTSKVLKKSLSSDESICYPKFLTSTILLCMENMWNVTLSYVVSAVIIITPLTSVVSSAAGSDFTFMA